MLDCVVQKLEYLCLSLWDDDSITTHDGDFEVEIVLILRSKLVSQIDKGVYRQGIDNVNVIQRSYGAGPWSTKDSVVLQGSLACFLDHSVPKSSFAEAPHNGARMSRCRVNN